MPSTTRYVDESTQTIIQGLAHDPTSVPSELSPHPSQDPQGKGKGKGKAKDMTTTDHPSTDNGGHTQNLPRKKRPPFNARISLPTPDVDAEGPRSPPPTFAAMSPLPAANRLHAGHTPIIPRSRSPLQEPEQPQEQEQEQEQDENRQPSPDVDKALSGHLTLPADPHDLDGSDDRIMVSVLDARLETVARNRQLEPEESSVDQDTEQNTENGGDNSENGGNSNRQDVPETGRRSSADEVDDIDGVILKKNTPMNMGAPLGQA